MQYCSNDTHSLRLLKTFIRSYVGRLVPTVPELWLTAVKNINTISTQLQATVIRMFQVRTIV